LSKKKGAIMVDVDLPRMESLSPGPPSPVQKYAKDTAKKFADEVSLYQVSINTFYVFGYGLNQ
jgi:hypothetical protein